MKRIKNTISRASLISLLVLGSTLTFAHSQGHQKLTKALELTPTQQQAFDQLHSDKKAFRKAQHEQKLAMKQRTKALLMDYSQDQADALADEVASSARTKALMRFEHMHRVMAILDDEQKQTFLKMIERKRNKRLKYGH